MKGFILSAYRFNLAYAQELVADIPEEQFAQIPGPGLENHPAFTVGHLVMGSARVGRMLGLAWDTPEGWRELFDRNGPGDPRVPDQEVDSYPSKTQLLSELERQHQRVEEAITSCDQSRWEEAVEWRFDSYFPTVQEVVAFMCITHESNHLAQLAAWRRAMGYASALAKL